MLYAYMVQQGMTSAQLAITGENEYTKAAYNDSYSKAVQRFNAASARVAAERNIAAVHQDKILSNSIIRERQIAAEAEARVSAATAGVSGRSVLDTISMTKTNEQRQLQQVSRAADQSVEDLLSTAGNAQSTLLSVRDTDRSVTGELLKAFSHVDSEDIKKGYEMYKEWSNG